MSVTREPATRRPPVRAELEAQLPGGAPAAGQRVEDALLQHGIVSERDLALELALGSGRRFTGLRDLTPNPGLFLYVPLALAERELVLPMLLVGDTLTVASAYFDPDLAIVRQRFPRLKLDIQMATRSEILTALARATRPGA